MWIIEKEKMVKIQVEQGVLEGQVLDLVTGDGQYYSFKGLPYAEPPVGPLRFKVCLFIINRINTLKWKILTSSQIDKRVLVI